MYLVNDTYDLHIKVPGLFDTSENLPNDDNPVFVIEIYKD